MTTPFHNLDAALPGLSASSVILACNSADRTLGLGLHRTVRAVLGQPIGRASGRDYDAALAFIAGFIAPIQLDDVTGEVNRSYMSEACNAARLCAEAVLAVRQAKNRLPIEAIAAE
jgi:hypothetical protein